MKIANSKKKVSVIYSYHESYEISVSDKTGFFKGMFKSGFIKDVNFEIQELFMNSKLIAKDRIPIVGNETLEVVQEFEPDVALCFDDNAFKYVCRNLFKTTKVIFAGVNADISSYNDTDHHFLKSQEYAFNLTGYTEPTFTNEILSLYSTITESIQSGDVISVVYDSTVTGISSSLQVKKEIEEVGNPENYIFEHHEISTIEELKSYISEANKNTSIKLFYPLVYSLLDEESGNLVSSEDINPLIASLSTIGTIATTKSQCKAGFFLGFDEDREGIGELLGELTSRILKKQVEIENCPIISSANSVPRISIVNLDTAKQLGYEIDSMLQYFDGKFYEEVYEANWILPMIAIIILSVVIAVVLILLFIIVAVLIAWIKYSKRKEKELNVIVTMISFMKLDSNLISNFVSKTKKTKLEKKLEGIIHNLKLFAPFIPREIQKSLSKKDDGSQESSSSASESSGSGNFPLKDQDENKKEEEDIRKKLIGNDALEWKTVSFLKIKLLGIVEGLEVLSPWYVKQLMNKFIGICDFHVSMNGGIIQTINEDEISATFNSVDDLENHFKKACITGCAINQSWKKHMNSEILLEVTAESGGHNKPIFQGGLSNLDHLRVLNTICSIEPIRQLTGAIGSKNFKTFSSLKKKKSLNIIDLNSKYQTNILIDGNNLDQITSIFHHRYLDEIKKNDKEKSLCTIYPIKRHNSKQGKNWLYQDEEDNGSQQEKKNPYRKYNLSYEMFKNGNFEEAEIMLNEYLKQNPQDKYAN